MSSLHLLAKDLIEKICEEVGIFYSITDEEWDSSDKKNKIQVRLRTCGLDLVVSFFEIQGHDSYQTQVEDFKKAFRYRLEHLREDIQKVEDRLRQEGEVL